MLLAFKTAERHKLRLILANDPDADRLAVAERIAPFVDGDGGCPNSGKWRFDTKAEKMTTVRMRKDMFTAVMSIIFSSQAIGQASAVLARLCVSATGV